MMKYNVDLKQLIPQFDKKVEEVMEDFKNPKKDPDKARGIAIELKFSNTKAGIVVASDIKIKTPPEMGGKQFLDMAIDGQMDMNDLVENYPLPHDDDGVICKAVEENEKDDQ